MADYLDSLFQEPTAASQAAWQAFVDEYQSSE